MSCFINGLPGIRLKKSGRSGRRSRLAVIEPGTGETMIRLKRVYDPPAGTDGVRLLAERLWPRGLKKDAAKLDGWLREVAPSTDLRKWFSHDPAKWPEFQRGYAAELDRHPEAWQPILDMARKGDVTLLFSSHDAQHNNVVALKAYLEKQTRKK